MKGFSISGRLGVNGLDSVEKTADWQVNDTLEFSTDSGVLEAMYLRAGAGGVVAGDVCAMKDGIAVPMNPTDDSGRPLCVACASIPAGSYGWFGIKGTVRIASVATTTAGGKVYMSATAGKASAVAAGKPLLNAVFAEDKTITESYQLVLATIQHPVQETA